MKNLPNITSTWTSSDFSVFKIEKLEFNAHGIWVYYINVETRQQYTCLAEAFLERFREQLA